MIVRKSILLLVSLSMIAALVACGSSSNSISDPPITVKVSEVPASLQVSATQPVTATTNDTAGVAWSCTPGNTAATCGSFSSARTSSGTAVTYTAPTAVPASAIVITATSMTNAAISGSTPAITIQATTPPPPITVTLSATPTSLYVNGTTPVTATVANDPANQGVTWSCAPAGSCGTFSSSTSASGAAVTYTAPATVPASTVVITATSVSNATISSSTPAITINAAIPPPPGITVTLSATSTSLYVNDTTSVSATVTNDTANQGVTWSCAPAGSCGAFSSPTSASGAAVTYTAPATVPASAVVITATSVSNPAVSSSTPAITIKAAVISVTLSTAPPSLMFEGAKASIAASVTGDPAAQGVNWSCTPASSCGSFNPTSTASAASTVYTVGSAAGPAVVITATSVSDNAQSATANVRILPTGTYVFSLTGISTDGYLPYSVAGAFTVAGGVITRGEQDFVDYFGNANDQINPTGSSISSTADGNLQITLVTCNGSNCNSTDSNIGVNGDGIEIIDGTVLPLSTNGRTFITEFDGWATSSGELDLQDNAAATTTPTLGYIFGLSGLDPNGVPLSMGGVIKVDNLTGTGTISGMGSIFDANDGGSGTSFQAETFAASSVSLTAGVLTPNVGRVLFKLNPTDQTDFSPIVLAGYIVDTNRIRLVETFDAYEGSLGGTAFSQGANTGQFPSVPMPGESYVVGLNGYDLNGVLQVAGLITFGATSVTGFVDFNDLALVEPASPDPVAAPAYTVDSTGRVTITGLADTSGVADANLQLYLDGNGHVLAITMDSSDIIAGGGSLQSGAGSFAFNGAYGVNVTGWDRNYYGEFDAAGPVVASGSNGTVAGTVDLNWLFSSGPTYTGAPVSGTFTGNANGIFTGTVTGVDVTNCQVFTPTGSGCTPDVFNYYMIDAAGDNIAIETDTNQLTLGLFAQQ